MPHSSPVSHSPELSLPCAQTTCPVHSLGTIINLQTGPRTQRAGRDQGKRQPSRLVGGGFTAGKLTEACLGCSKMRSLYPPTRTLQVYIEALTGLSHVHHPDGLSNTLLSHARVLENSSHGGSSGQNTHSKDGGGVRSLSLPGASSRVNRCHILSITSSNNSAKMSLTCWYPPSRLYQSACTKLAGNKFLLIEGIIRHGKRRHICMYTFKKYFSWNIIALQCCASFCCPSEGNQLYVYICSFPLGPLTLPSSQSTE